MRPENLQEDKPQLVNENHNFLFYFKLMKEFVEKQTHTEPDTTDDVREHSIVPRRGFRQILRKRP